MALLAGTLPIGSLGNLHVDRKYRAQGIGPPVKDSDEITRMLHAPQRPVPTKEQKEAWIEKWTNALAIGHKAGCGCPITRLNAVQAWALEEASTGQSGVIGSLRIGSGKTGLDVLYAMVVPGVTQAVLLIPPALRAQFAADFAKWALHFRVPNLAGSSNAYYRDRPVLRVLAYSELSNPAATLWFQTHKPELVIGDEVQALADRRSVRTDRFIRHFISQPDTIFLGHTGSLTTKSTLQFFHLLALALREKSPLAIDPPIAEEHAALLDPEPPNGFRPPVGAMQRLCVGDETPQESFHRRFVATPGVVTTDDSRLSVGVSIQVRSPGIVPQPVRDALAIVRQKAQRPDGEELLEADKIAACARQIATGCYMRWKFPHGEPEELIDAWFSARKAFGAELRERMTRRVEHMDSPTLCRNAAERFYADYQGHLPKWHAVTWPAWRDIKDAVYHEQDVVWIDDFLLRDAAAWALADPGVVFVDHPAFGHRLAQMTGLDYYGSGPQASAAILKFDETHGPAKRSIIASLRAHGTGKNLQAFNRVLIVDMPSDAGIVEQAIGRLYRPGQHRDVSVFRYAHTHELAGAYESVLRKAEYVRVTDGLVHVVLFAETT